MRIIDDFKFEIRCIVTAICMLLISPLFAQGGFSINYLPRSVLNSNYSDSSPHMLNFALSLHVVSHKNKKIESSLFLRAYESEDFTLGLDVNRVFSLSKRLKFLLGIGAAIENPWDFSPSPKTLWTAFVVTPQSRVRFFFTRSLFISAELNYNVFLQKEIVHGSVAGFGIGFILVAD